MNVRARYIPSDIDKCHGDEQWAPDLIKEEIDLIETDFWDKTLWDHEPPDELADLLCANESAKQLLFQICSMARNYQPNHERFADLAKRVNKLASELVRDQIEQGNIRANSDD